MTDSTTPVHDVLWTGGWDSTFRVLDLVLTHGRVVRPWYITDPERRTTRRELHAMAEIRRLTAALDGPAAARILPLEERALCSVPDDPHLRAAAGEMRTRTELPAQYEWLAMFARAEGIVGLELGVEDRAGTPAFAGVAVGRCAAPAPDDWWFIEPDGTPADSFAILGSFRLPVLEMEKWEMEAIAHERGFADILEATWFCRWPTVLGRPCGFCVPCRGTRVGGLGRRVPAPTRTRAVLHRTRWDLVRRGQVLRANAGSVTRRLGRSGA
jgi:hypothetical protein